MLVNLGGDSRGLGAIVLAKLCHGQGGRLLRGYVNGGGGDGNGSDGGGVRFSFAAAAVAALASAERSFFLPKWRPVLLGIMRQSD